MIEYCHDGRDKWHKMPSKADISELVFVGYSIRIDDIIYIQNDAKFREAWRRELFWSKIRDS